ncbi:hypothetical protein A2230_06420 [candidate division WOR-1 bacterium RIFOXYA2_FULL_36_21]|uniref:Uncharacterized protein n=1 Tax=candidate division WOR-1 bacterium RIFOXYB2_FULL_36_35 TaxID=1802578 RepID=A0A1F4S388_UNCSA|nr:MAG: hypothetical protein A2230_06420 [candidate division WOR-1 bacterium RIFOXYA2_FULL_36_21]OGC14891.1 MAG: hypothetical protein A2290_07320 [candidate division WOR-1 bacterium RIFOXYB2_FULL_36_35]OGC16721.1 MAG: hypothetical protein A2282_03875 [candidate division WOR-1 bacterium RIFOXYA12_FULL_36_13]
MVSIGLNLISYFSALSATHLTASNDSTNGTDTTLQEVDPAILQAQYEVVLKIIDLIELKDRVSTLADRLDRLDPGYSIRKGISHKLDRFFVGDQRVSFSEKDDFDFQGEDKKKVFDALIRAGLITRKVVSGRQGRHCILNFEEIFVSFAIKNIVIDGQVVSDERKAKIFTSLLALITKKLEQSLDESLDLRGFISDAEFGIFGDRVRPAVVFGALSDYVEKKRLLDANSGHYYNVYVVKKEAFRTVASDFNAFKSAVNIPGITEDADLLAIYRILQTAYDKEKRLERVKDNLSAAVTKSETPSTSSGDIITPWLAEVGERAVYGTDNYLQRLDIIAKVRREIGETYELDGRSYDVETLTDATSIIASHEKELLGKLQGKTKELFDTAAGSTYARIMRVERDLSNAINNKKESGTVGLDTSRTMELLPEMVKPSAKKPLNAFWSWMATQGARGGLTFEVPVETIGSERGADLMATVAVKPSFSGKIGDNYLLQFDPYFLGLKQYGFNLHGLTIDPDASYLPKDFSLGVDIVNKLNVVRQSFSTIVDGNFLANGRLSLGDAGLLYGMNGRLSYEKNRTVALGDVYTTSGRFAFGFDLGFSSNIFSLMISFNAVWQTAPVVSANGMETFSNVLAGELPVYRGIDASLVGILDLSRLGNFTVNSYFTDMPRSDDTVAGIFGIYRPENFSSLYVAGGYTLTSDNIWKPGIKVGTGEVDLFGVSSLGFVAGYTFDRSFGNKDFNFRNGTFTAGVVGGFGGRRRVSVRALRAALRSEREGRISRSQQRLEIGRANVSPLSTNHPYLEDIADLGKYATPLPSEESIAQPISGEVPEVSILGGKKIYLNEEMSDKLRSALIELNKQTEFIKQALISLGVNDESVNRVERIDLIVPADVIAELPGEIVLEAADADEISKLIGLCAVGFIEEAVDVDGSQKIIFKVQEFFNKLNKEIEDNRVGRALVALINAIHLIDPILSETLKTENPEIASSDVMSRAKIEYLYSRLDLYAEDGVSVEYILKWHENFNQKGASLPLDGVSQERSAVTAVPSQEEGAPALQSPSEPARTDLSSGTAPASEPQIFPTPQPERTVEDQIPQELLNDGDPLRTMEQFIYGIEEE